MITPKFSLDQTEDFVIFKIHAPYIKAPLIQFEVSENIFVFSLPPYYLRLRLPGQLIEDEFMDSKYDVKTGDITCRVSKLHKGEQLEDLDMISKLLATKKQTNQSKPKIEVVNSEANPNENEESDSDIELEQTEFNPLTNKTSYGFNNQYQERIGLSIHLGNEINELDDPEVGDSATRLEEMRSKISGFFDPDYYIADYFDNDMILEALKFQLPGEIQVDFDLQDQLLKLGNREHLISDSKPIYLGLVPILFGWCYDYRTNFGDHSVESSWNIGKLAPSMCYLYNDYHNLSDLVKDVTIRSLSRPLYRHWELTKKVWEDVAYIIGQGRREVLKVLVSCVKLFEHECHQYYREILLEDYCIWVQQSSDTVLTSISNELKKTVASFTRSAVNLRLDEIIKDAETDAHNGLINERIAGLGQENSETTSTPPNDANPIDSKAEEIPIDSDDESD